MVTLKTIDAHAAGGPLRLVVDGFPAPRGRTMPDKAAWVERHADSLREILMREPRGHADMCGALLTEPAAPGSHAGVIFMNASGYPALSGHGIIAIATIALERGLLMAGGDGLSIVFDTVAGTVRVRAAGTPERVDRVTMIGVPSFVARGSVAVKAGGRLLRADVAYAGGFFAIVDSEAVGLSVDLARIPELRRAGREIAEAVDAVQPWVHPGSGRQEACAGVIFTAPPRAEDADLRSVTVLADGQVGRSPGGTGTAALMAVLDAMGLLGADHLFVHEGIAGTRLTGRVLSRTLLGEQEGLVVEVEGSAWITGEHTFISAPGDPLAEGLSQA